MTMIKIGGVIMSQCKVKRHFQEKQLCHFHSYLSSLWKLFFEQILFLKSIFHFFKVLNNHTTARFKQKKEKRNMNTGQKFIQQMNTSVTASILHITDKLVIC